MSADIFSRNDARKFLHDKCMFMFGDSNMRAIYKDMVWLVEEGTTMPNERLKIKNELSHAGDQRISNGELTSSRNYIEVREYNKECLIHFEFITRLFTDGFKQAIEELRVCPNFIIINSCVWDLSRWGPNGIQDYKKNVEKTFEFLREKCPKSSIIFTTTLPPSLKARGGFLTENIKFLNNILPFNIVEANHFTASLCAKYNVDVIDLHYNLRIMLDYRNLDGIHWDPIAIRFVTNAILTSLSISTFKELPGNSQLLYNYNFHKTGDQNNNGGASSNKAAQQQLNENIPTPTNSRKRKRSVGYTNELNTELFTDNHYQRLYDFKTK